MSDPGGKKPLDPKHLAPHVEYREEVGGASGTSAAAQPARESGSPAKAAYVEVESPGHKKMFSMDTEDIVAVGALILCIGAVMVAVIVAFGYVFGKVDGAQATKIILGCVGGAAIAGVISAATKKNKDKKA